MFTLSTFGFIRGEHQQDILHRYLPKPLRILRINMEHGSPSPVRESRTSPFLVIVLASQLLFQLIGSMGDSNHCVKEGY